MSIIANISLTILKHIHNSEHEANCQLRFGSYWLDCVCARASSGNFSS